MSKSVIWSVWLHRQWSKRYSKTRFEASFLMLCFRKKLISIDTISREDSLSEVNCGHLIVAKILKKSFARLSSMMSMNRWSNYG